MKLYLVTIKDKQSCTTTFPSLELEATTEIISISINAKLPNVIWVKGTIFFTDNLASINIKEEIHG